MGVSDAGCGGVVAGLLMVVRDAGCGGGRCIGSHGSN